MPQLWEPSYPTAEPELPYLQEEVDCGLWGKLFHNSWATRCAVGCVVRDEAGD